MPIRSQNVFQPTRAAWVLIISGILGFRVGAVGFADWQVVVETAQVLAGIVTYPAPTPFYVYHTKLWTVLHQICAVFLRAGVSEIALSTIVSGVAGMLAFQGLGIFVYALSGDALLAIGAGFLILFSRVFDFGGVYPIFLMGTTHTYGILGISAAVLAVGLIGAGCYRLGGFLLGLAPAVHPSIGASLAVIVGVCFLWDFRSAREELRPALRYFLAGCGVTALSLALQFAFAPDLPRVAPEAAHRYLAAFAAFWDGHRTPVKFLSAATALNLGALTLALTWLMAFAADLPRASLFLLRVVCVSAVMSLVLIFVSWMPPDRMPVTLLILMPGRLLNIDVVTFTALLLGLIGAYRERMWSAILMLFLTGGLLLSNYSMLWYWRQSLGVRVPDSPINPLVILAITSVSLVVCMAVPRWWAPSFNRPASPMLRILRLSSLGVIALSAALTWRLSTPRRITFRDRTNDPFFAEVAKGNGLLLTGGDLHLIQLRTRRPVLLDGGGLDGLPYSLEAGPEMERILRDVYAIDFFHPPEAARGSGTIPTETNRMAWEQYSIAKWQEIRRTYHVSQVVTPADWVLKLPPKAQDRRLLLYEIPD